jgi:uncharacterized phiE125 gp8 family phage protein
MAVSLEHHYPTLTVTVEPALEPVTLPEAMAYAEYEGDEESKKDLMRSLLVTARRKVERDAAVALITQTRVAKFSCFPRCGEQAFPVAPVQTVAITYLDIAGASQTWGTSNYQVDTTSRPPRVAPVWNQIWPVTSYGTFNAATFTIVCGYGDTADLVPEEAKTAIKLLAKTWFWNRCVGVVTDEIDGQYMALIGELSWRPVNV